jgi:hypothetical protein
MDKMIAQPTVLHEIIFELGSAGGGSFWAEDYLLATLTIQQRTGRQGRLSLRDTNRALDMVCYPSKQRKEYRLVEGMRLLSRAEWQEGAPSARLNCGDRDYAVTPTGLFAIKPEFEEQPVVAFGSPASWHSSRWTLRVEAGIDLPLIVFYLFIGYDLFRTEWGGQPSQLK